MATEMKQVLYSYHDAVAYLRGAGTNVCRQTLWRMKKDGRISTVRVSNRDYIRIETLEEMIGQRPS